MKEALLELYRANQSGFKAVLDAHPGEDMAGPHLMSPNALYPLQKHRLLIVGQETGGWSYHVDHLAQQMRVYEEFNLGERYYASPFWNVTRKVERALGIAPYSCAWTNISKFDHNNGRASGDVAVSISKMDWILREEIRILEPSICLFYTGPAFDGRIRELFPNVEYVEVEGFDERRLVQLEHPSLPKHSYRSYHPNYLRQQGLEDDFLGFIARLS